MSEKPFVKPFVPIGAQISAYRKYNKRLLRGAKAKLSEPRDVTYTEPEDDITRAQHTICGLCPECGEEGQAKYKGMCFPCFAHHKTHS